MQQGKEIPQQKWDEFLESLQEHFGAVSLVCNEMKIARRSYYNKRLKDPEFANKADLIFERLQVPIAEEMLRTNVLKDNWQAIRYTLDRASRKWHPKLSSDYISELEERLLYLEIELRKKLDPNFKVQIKDRTKELMDLAEEIEKSEKPKF